MLLRRLASAPSVRRTANPVSVQSCRFLSTTPTLANSGADKKKDHKKTATATARTVIRSILYGTKKEHNSRDSHHSPQYSVLPRPEDEQQPHRDTHSKLLARGKYVHELQVHDVVPGHADAYRELCAVYYPRLLAATNGQVNLVGSWQTIVGDLDQTVHMLEYKDQYSGFDAVRSLVAKSSDLQKLERDMRGMLHRRTSQICLEFAFWMTSAPKVHGGIYELRTYELKPGSLLEWETHWKRGLECRRRFCQPVGAWFSQLGQLNMVHHMWHYPDLETRKATREAAWQVEGWPETVWNTVPLVQHMHTRILQPLPFSPLK